MQLTYYFVCCLSYVSPNEDIGPGRPRRLSASCVSHNALPTEYTQNSQNEYTALWGKDYFPSNLQRSKTETHQQACS